MRMQKRTWLTTLILAVAMTVCMSLPSASAAVLGGQIVDVSNSTMDLYFAFSSKSYTDGLPSEGNPEAKLRIYGTAAVDVASKYVAGVYAINTSGSGASYNIITADTSPPALGITGAAFPCPAPLGGFFCADTSTVVNFQTNKGSWGGAAFYPGNIFMLVSPDDSITFGAGDNIVPVSAGVTGDSSSRSAVSGGNGTLLGTYTTNPGLQDSYNQTTGTVLLDIDDVEGRINGGSLQSLVSYHDDPYMHVGICTDALGLSCASKAATNVSASAVSLFTGVVSPPDTTITRPYSVINGLGIQFCIGPDISIANPIGASPTGGFPGIIVNVSAVVTNANNVDVTQSFNVSFYRDAVKIGERNISGGLAAGASKTVWLLYNTSGLTAGGYTMRADADDGSIGDCNNGNDDGTRGITLAKAYVLDIYIDGNLSTYFPDVGRAYNVTAHLYDTDGNNISNAIIRITEENGLSLFSPQQIFNETPAVQNGLKPISYGQTITDANGLSSFALIPTGNKLYEPGYAYLNVSYYVGNYSLYAEAFNPAGTEYQLIDNGTFVDEKALVIGSYTPAYPTAAEINSTTVIRQDNFVQQMLEYIDQAFATAFLRLEK